MGFILLGVERNIKIAYVLSFLKNSWFWLGTWVFYYLLFTNYAGIGLIETFMISALVISEVPSGVLADLIGRKKVLILSFMVLSVGLYLASFASSFIWIVVGITLAGIGHSCYSGTNEALVFDSLKEKNQSDRYGGVISRMNAVAWAAPAICGLIGGFLYLINPRLPFLLNAICYTVAIIFCLFLKEPKIDSVKFSFKNFFIQTKVGAKELFRDNYMLKQTLLLLSIGLVIVICDEMLNGFLAVEFNFRAEQLGALWAVIYLMSAVASERTTYLFKILASKLLIFVTGFIIAITLLISPFVGIFFGGFSLLVRSCLQAVYNNIASEMINKRVESNKRATTLSTFNLMKNMPYVLGAYYLGYLADIYSAVWLATVLGGVLLVLIFIQNLSFIKLKMNE